jgi:ABC-type branched-subunit amino acid transport system substrate-binding protein
MRVQDTGSERPEVGRWRLLLVAVGLVLAAALLVSACGNSGGSDTNASSGGSSQKNQGTSSVPKKKATGSVIKAMTVASVNTEGPPFPNIPKTAEIYGQWINDHGGVNGHRLQVITCDDRGVAPQATSCARKAVSEKVAAVVGSYTFVAESIVPILERANIAWFGTCCPGTPSELTSKASFPVGSGPLYSTGFTKRAIDDGCKKINAVVIDGAQPYIPLMEGAMKAAGKQFASKPIILPATSQDYSPQVAQATSKGADCVLMVVSEGPYQAWMGPWAQSGTQARMYGPQGNLNAKVVKGTEQAAEGAVIAGSYPDISTKPWADFRAALQDYKAPAGMDFNSLAGMGTWAGYSAFTQIASGIKGEVTGKAFLDAASKTTKLDLKGMVPPIDFTKEWTDLKGYTRLFNHGVVFSKIKGGKVVPLTTSFEDVTNAALGKAG